MSLNPQSIVICMGGPEARDRTLEAELEKLGLLPSTRWLSAVDGHRLPPLGPWTVEGLTASAWFNWEDPYSGRAMTLGEVGCALSHVRCWQMAAEADQPTLVLEEDARLRPGCEGWFQAALDDLEMLQDWELCYLARLNAPQRPSSLVGRYIHRVDYQPSWGLAYLLSPRGAQRLLQTPWKEHLAPADEVLPACFGLHANQDFHRIYHQPKATMVTATHQNLFAPRDSSPSHSRTERSAPVHYRDNGLVAFTGATQDRPELRRLQLTAARYAVNLTVLEITEEQAGGQPRQERGDQPFHRVQTALEELAEDQVVLFLKNCEEVVVTGHVSQILATYRKLEAGVVFAAQRFFAAEPELADRFPETDGPWRFLQPGCFIGRAGELRALFRKPVTNNDDELRHFSRLLLSGEHDIALDTGCRIFQCINGTLAQLQVDSGRGRLYNKHHQTWPAIVHASGPFREWLDQDGRPVGGRWRGSYELNQPPGPSGS